MRGALHARVNMGGHLGAGAGAAGLGTRTPARVGSRGPCSWAGEVSAEGVAAGGPCVGVWVQEEARSNGCGRGRLGVGAG